ncbi:hypothetical protein HDU93_004863 [Gonapodya sp. JEL0774]|nr:hypothetical protein HDU93_004863 [Gonapodya sp. JEL0774]
MEKNPSDTEESLWHFLSLSLLHSPSYARAHWLPVGTDPRPVMRRVYEAYLNSDPSAAADANAVAVEAIYHALTPGDRQSHDGFYAALYAGLWHEAYRGKGSERSREWMGRALETEYARGKGKGDYMVGLAEVHWRVRGWGGMG